MRIIVGALLRGDSMGMTGCTKRVALVRSEDYTFHLELSEGVNVSQPILTIGDVSVIFGCTSVTREALDFINFKVKEWDNARKAATA